MSANITGSIRLAEMINGFWEGRAKKKIANALDTIERALETEKYFGYLVRTDRMGYLRALSRAKSTFRGLNRDDVSEGMVDSSGINPLFVEMVEDFYYTEIRKEADINQLKLARYNAFRDEFISEIRKNSNVFTEDYAQEDFGISREEMLKKTEANELIFAFVFEENGWDIVTREDYREYVKEGVLEERYPLALVG